MAWQQMVIRLDAGLIGQTEAILRLAGAEALAISDAGNDPLLEPAAGATPLWPTVTLTALFDAALDPDRIAALLPPEIDATSVEVAPVSERDWIDAWRESVTPIVVGNRLEIVPLGNADNPATALRLMLAMGLAFGTGRHPTTRLCLEWLAARNWSDTCVLDFGCGSGVLALAALRLGARFAWATDSEDQALVATRENARLNGIENRLWVGRPESLPQLDADLVMANILAGTLRRLAGSFAAWQKPGGRIVFSGVLESQADAVLDAYAPFYDDFETTRLEGWIMHAGVRTDRIAEARQRP